MHECKFGVNIGAYKSNNFLSFFNTGSHKLLISALGLLREVGEKSCPSIYDASFRFRIIE